MIWNALISWMFPELGLFESPDDQRQAIERVKDAVAERGSYIGLLFLLTVGLLAIDWVVRKRFGLSDSVVLLKPVIAMLISGWIAIFLMRRRLRPVLWEFMNERGMPTCVNCGYDLRGQTERRCPECGTAF